MGVGKTVQAIALASCFEVRPPLWLASAAYLIDAHGRAWLPRNHHLPCMPVVWAVQHLTFFLWPSAPGRVAAAGDCAGQPAAGVG